MPEQAPPGRHGVEIPDDVAARLGGESKRAFPPRHNHLTRDVKPRGVCPACDAAHHGDET